MRSFSWWFRSLWSVGGLCRSTLALLVLLGTLTMPPLLHGQTPGNDLSRITRPWITVTVPSTDPGDTRSEVLAGVIADNLDLTLRLIGEYVVRPRPTVRTTPTDAAEAAAFAESEGLDYVVFGRVSELAEGATLFSLSVYSREDGTVTLEREAVAASVFETFDVADELAVDILGAFTGQRIAYGRIDLANLAEEPGEYLVYLDGEPAGTNVRVLERVLVGERLVEVVALEGPGAGRTMASERVLVAEGSRAAVSFFFARPVVREVAEVEPEPDHGDKMMARALARLETERRALSAATPDTFMPMGTRVSVPVAEELFLSAGEYPDPDAIRAAALENAQISADLQILIGRRLLAGRKYDEGAIAHQHVTDMARTFGRDDLFGYRDAVSAVNWNWSEFTVQRELKPMPWLPVVVTAWAMNFFFSRHFGDAGVGDIETDSFVTDRFPLVPLLFGTGIVSVWNSNDWSIPQHRRLLRRIGTSDPHSSVPTARTVWNPAPWEISIGMLFGFENAVYRIYGVKIPEELRRANWSYDDDSLDFRVEQGGIGMSLTLRRWINHRNALAFGLVFGDDLFGAYDFLDAEIEGSRHGEYLKFDNPFQTSLLWVHTRTGRSLIEAGMTYYPILFREPTFSDSVAPIVERDFYRELVGDDDFTMHVFGALLGVGWRFGALPRRPWEFSFRYRLARFNFTDGVLGDQDPLWGHGVSFAFTRSVGLGGNYQSVDVVKNTDLSTARSTAEDKWQPSRLAVFVDPGGVLGWGPRFGLEWHLSDRWSLSAWGRQYISESRFSPAGTISRVYGHYEKLFVPDGYIFPGIGARRYFHEDRRGWYAGGLVELVSFNNLRVESTWEFDDKTVELDGRWVVPQLEGGYRMKIWRSLSLDAGIQAGMTIGSVDQVSYLGDLGSPGVDRQHEPWGSTKPWYNIVLSISTPLFTDVREHPIADTISAEVPGDDSSESAHGTVRETSPSLRPEVQVAGGTLLVGGFSYPIGTGGFELTLLGGVGQAQGLKVALAQRLTWTMPERRVAPRVSAYAVEVTDLSDIGIAVGPSVGVAFKLQRFASAIVFDNAFVVNFRPYEPEYMVYMPSIGVRF